MIITLDTLTAGGHFDYTGAPVVNGVEYVLTNLTGWWGSPAPRVKRTDRPTAPGAYRAAAYKGVRVPQIEVVGTAVAQDDYSMRLAEQKVAAVCSDPSQLYRLYVEDAAGATCAYVELDGEILTAPRDGMSWSTKWNIPLAAPDPRRLAANWNSTTAPAMVVGSGGVVSTSTGVVSTGSGILSGTAPVPAVASTVGTGTADNGLVFQITGSGSGFFVTDTTNGPLVGYAGALGSTDSVFINCSNQPAYDVPGASGPIPARGALLGTSTARSAVSVRGGWPVLKPGQTGTYLFSGALGAGASLTVHTRGAWA